ncbi:MAG TPA: cysteine--tRNA ligase [Chthonomonadaceae bacterium]|nr:cysteine--tRNA ligase [Chthonomonadaceae bacterium]
MSMFTLYNTMSRSKEQFTPLDPPNVRMYCCGLTVYNYAHIGNLRTYVFEDILRRVIRFNGFHLTHVQNVTDVGHMTSDADAGEDKMEVTAKRENKSPWELARFYEEAAVKDFKRLNIEMPELMPRATEHVTEMISLIETLEANGYTYKTTEAVYFDTSKFPNYGKLARLNLDQQQTNRAEVVADETKKNQSDFVLWFLNKPTHIMQWNSPWGPGYPGWHIECSAMSMKYLGPTLDIHCGGIDHIPVHHTNEIAQSECATHKTFARFWVHGEFLLMGGGKMSKSELSKLKPEDRPPSTLQELIDRGFDPLAYRYLCLQAHYRSELNFTVEALEAATAGLRKVYGLCPETDPLRDDAAAYAAARERVIAAINDDLGLPQAVGLLNSHGSHRLWLEFDPILGLQIAERSCRQEEALPDEIVQLVEARNEARREKRWAESDAIRNQLIERGYEVGDGPQGTTIKRRVI